MVSYPSLYEINTRIWLKRFNLPGRKATLADIPDVFWEDLVDHGIDYVWLMGVWETTKSSIETFAFHTNLIQGYHEMDPYWNKNDITGSPYAIDDYIVSSHLGTNDDLLKLRDQLHKWGLKLILDFVPNHFNAHSGLLSKHPEIFIQCNAHKLEVDASTCYQWGNQYFAHGKDPYFDAWTDTVQINYFRPGTHEFMRNKLFDVAKFCDGVRCDMAMLIFPDIFQKTWSHYIPHDQQQYLEFWPGTIQAIRKEKPDFLFIAEAYWDTQYRLQQQGFDYTYDKRLLDFLISGDAHRILGHLQADIAFQSKTARFIENHDEERAYTSLGTEKSRAASVIISTLPGMRLYHQGQWEGRRKKLPVQFGREAKEISCACTLRQFFPLKSDTICACLSNHYQQLLRATKADIFKNGEWELLNNFENINIFCWIWTKGTDIRLVTINYSARIQSGYIDHERFGRLMSVHDELNQKASPDYMIFDSNKKQWKISLPAYRSAIFSFA
jgi:hypothetical protein